MIKKFAIIGAAIGAAGGFALQAGITAMAFMAGPGVPGLFEMAFHLIVIGILTAMGAAVGLVGGLLVGIVVSRLSRSKGVHQSQQPPSS